MNDFILLETEAKGYCENTEQDFDFCNNLELIRKENIIKAYVNRGGGHPSDNPQGGNCNICVVVKDDRGGETVYRDYYLNFENSDKSFVSNMLAELRNILNNDRTASEYGLFTPRLYTKTMPKKEANTKSGLEVAKENLINILFNCPQIYPKIKDVIKPEFFCDEVYENFLNAIIEIIENGEVPLNPATAFNQMVTISGHRTRWEDTERLLKIIGKPLIYADKNVLEKNINDYIKCILEKYYSNKISEEKDIDKVKELLGDKKKLHKIYIQL